MKRSGGYIQQITGYKAFIPAPLPPDPAIKLDGTLQNLLSKADMSLARLDGMGYILPDVNFFIAMYVRKEALLSSQIEGTQASLKDLFGHESGDKPGNGNDVSDVVNYVKALNHGIERLGAFPMSLRLIKEIHEILMANVRGSERKPGEFKQAQNWIGPSGCTLNDATFIPPPPHESAKAMGDLEHYIHTEAQLPVLIDTAMIHYQFETIHPFLDGNGRLGRLLITFYLYWKNALNRPLLYLSYFFKRNRQEYYDRLQMVRETGNYEQWITFFLKGVVETADSAMETAKKILGLQSDHRSLLWKKKISSPIAVGMLESLFHKPYVSVNDIAKEFNVSFQTASTLVSQFEKAGILEETTGRKRDKRYVYAEYVNILSEGTQT